MPSARVRVVPLGADASVSSSRAIAPRHAPRWGLPDDRPIVLTGSAATFPIGERGRSTCRGSWARLGARARVVRRSGISRTSCQRCRRWGIARARTRSRWRSRPRMSSSAPRRSSSFGEQLHSRGGFRPASRARPLPSAAFRRSLDAPSCQLGAGTRNAADGKGRARDAGQTRLENGAGRRTRIAEVPRKTYRGLERQRERRAGSCDTPAPAPLAARSTDNRTRRREREPPDAPGSSAGAAPPFRRSERFTDPVSTMGRSSGSPSAARAAARSPGRKTEASAPSGTTRTRAEGMLRSTIARMNTLLVASSIPSGRLNNRWRSSHASWIRAGSSAGYRSPSGSCSNTRR